MNPRTMTILLLVGYYKLLHVYDFDMTTKHKEINSIYGQGRRKVVSYHSGEFGRLGG